VLRQLENLRLMTKIVIPMGIMLAVALGIVVLAERSLGALTAETHEIIQVTATRQALAFSATASVNGIAADEKNAMLMSDKSGLDVFASAYVGEMDHLEGTVAKLKHLSTGAAETARLDAIDHAAADYYATGKQLYQFMVDREFNEAHALSTGAAQTARERLVGLVREEADWSTAQMTQAEGRADAEYQHTVALLISVSAGGLVCALLAVGWITRQFIVGPLTAITDAMGRLSQGDMAITIDEAPRRDEIGILGRALMIFRDQSLKLRENVENLNAAHAEIRELNLELEARVEERTLQLRETQNELFRKERLSTIGQLTATVAHELRNPLSAIRNTIFSLQAMAKAQGLTLERSYSRIERSITRCDRIIADLLDFTRVKELKLRRQNLDEWIGSVLDEQHMPAGITLERTLGAGGAIALLDEDRFRRVLINLIENAVQAIQGAGNSGRISVSTAPHLAIEIEDTGPGIQPDVLPKIFDPLFSTKSFGTGLGLPTVRQIVEQHRGTVTVESELGRGTRVRIQLANDATEFIAA
jgi:signal transduction histidine kinase